MDKKRDSTTNKAKSTAVKMIFLDLRIKISFLFRSKERSIAQQSLLAECEDKLAILSLASATTSRLPSLDCLSPTLIFCAHYNILLYFDAVFAK